MISGLMRTILSSGFFLKQTSMTVRRCEMPICGSGEADALCDVHRFEHLFDQGLQLVVE